MSSDRLHEKSIIRCYLDSTKRITASHISPDRTLLALVYFNKCIIHETDTLKPVFHVNFSGSLHKSGIKLVRFTPASDFLITVGLDKNIIVWSLSANIKTAVANPSAKSLSIDAALRSAASSLSSVDNIILSTKTHPTTRVGPTPDMSQPTLSRAITTATSIGISLTPAPSLDIIPTHTVPRLRLAAPVFGDALAHVPAASLMHILSGHSELIVGVCFAPWPLEATETIRSSAPLPVAIPPRDIRFGKIEVGTGFSTNGLNSSVSSQIGLSTVMSTGTGISTGSGAAVISTRTSSRARTRTPSPSSSYSPAHDPSLSSPPHLPPSRAPPTLLTPHVEYYTLPYSPFARAPMYKHAEASPQTPTETESCMQTIPYTHITPYSYASSQRQDMHTQHNMETPLSSTCSASTLSTSIFSSSFSTSSLTSAYRHRHRKHQQQQSQQLMFASPFGTVTMPLPPPTPLPVFTNTSALTLPLPASLLASSVSSSSLLVSASVDGVLQVWDWRRGTLYTEGPTRAYRQYLQELEGARCLCVLPHVAIVDMHRHSPVPTHTPTPTRAQTRAQEGQMHEPMQTETNTETKTDRRVDAEMPLETSTDRQLPATDTVKVSTTPNSGENATSPAFSGNSLEIPDMSRSSSPTHPLSSTLAGTSSPTPVSASCATPTPPSPLKSTPMALLSLGSHSIALGTTKGGVAGWDVLTRTRGGYIAPMRRERDHEDDDGGRGSGVGHGTQISSMANTNTAATAASTTDTATDPDSASLPSLHAHNDVDGTSLPSTVRGWLDPAASHSGTVICIATSHPPSKYTLVPLLEPPTPPEPEAHGSDLAGIVEEEGIEVLEGVEGGILSPRSGGVLSPRSIWSPRNVDSLGSMKSPRNASSPSRPRGMFSAFTQGSASSSAPAAPTTFPTPATTGTAITTALVSSSTAAIATTPATGLNTTTANMGASTGTVAAAPPSMTTSSALQTAATTSHTPTTPPRHATQRRGSLASTLASSPRPSSPSQHQQLQPHSPPIFSSLSSPLPQPSAPSRPSPPSPSSRAAIATRTVIGHAALLLPPTTPTFLVTGSTDATAKVWVLGQWVAQMNGTTLNREFSAISGDAEEEGSENVVKNKEHGNGDNSGISCHIPEKNSNPLPSSQATHADLETKETSPSIPDPKSKKTSSSSDPLLYMTLRHDAAVKHVEITQNNKYVVTSALDSKIRIFHLLSGRVISVVHLPLPAEDIYVESYTDDEILQKALDTANLASINATTNAKAASTDSDGKRGYEYAVDLPMLSTLGSSPTIMHTSSLSTYGRRVKLDLAVSSNGRVPTSVGRSDGSTGGSGNGSTMNLASTDSNNPSQTASTRIGDDVGGCINTASGLLPHVSTTSLTEATPPSRSAPCKKAHILPRPVTHRSLVTIPLRPSPSRRRVKTNADDIHDNGAQSALHPEADREIRGSVHQAAYNAMHPDEPYEMEFVRGRHGKGRQVRNSGSKGRLLGMDEHTYTYDGAHDGSHAGVVISGAGDEWYAPGESSLHHHNATTYRTNSDPDINTSTISIHTTTPLPTDPSSLIAATQHLSLDCHRFVCRLWVTVARAVVCVDIFDDGAMQEQEVLVHRCSEAVSNQHLLPKRQHRDIFAQNTYTVAPMPASVPGVASAQTTGLLIDDTDDIEDSLRQYRPEQGMILFKKPGKLTLEQLEHLPAITPCTPRQTPLPASSTPSSVRSLLHSSPSSSLPTSSLPSLSSMPAPLPLHSSSSCTMLMSGEAALTLPLMQGSGVANGSMSDSSGVGGSERVLSVYKLNNGMDIDVDTNGVRDRGHEYADSDANTATYRGNGSLGNAHSAGTGTSIATGTGTNSLSNSLSSSSSHSQSASPSSSRSRTLTSTYPHTTTATTTTTTVPHIYTHVRTHTDTHTPTLAHKPLKPCDNTLPYLSTLSPHAPLPHLRTNLHETLNSLLLPEKTVSAPPRVGRIGVLTKTLPQGVSIPQSHDMVRRNQVFSSVAHTAIISAPITYMTYTSICNPIEMRPPTISPPKQRPSYLPAQRARVHTRRGELDKGKSEAGEVERREEGGASAERGSVPHYALPVRQRTRAHAYTQAPSQTHTQARAQAQPQTDALSSASPTHARVQAGTKVNVSTSGSDRAHAKSRVSFE